MNIIYKKLDEIKLSDFNPPRRTEQRRLKELTEKMLLFGFLPEFHLILGNDGVTIGDGHRRYTIAKQLNDAGYEGFSKVPVVISQLSAEDVFTFQAYGLKPNGTDILNVVVEGSIELSRLPASFKRHYDSIVAVCGPRAIEYMNEREVSPGKIIMLQKVIRYVQRQAPEVVTSQDFGFRLLEWMVSNNQTYQAMRFVDNGSNVERLLWAISNNKPLPR